MSHVARGGGSGTGLAARLGRRVDLATIGESDVKRVAELDSLRGLAALAILIFHLDPFAFPAGWTGVDLFFVLSGYLITGIILRHRDRPGFLRTFYIRRGLRIWPIYYLTLGVVLVANARLPRPEPTDALPYYLAYLQNIPMYWSGRVPPFIEAFDHTWTLALEEQFYILWPAIVMLVPRRFTAALCLATAVLSALAREGVAIYFILPVQFGPFMERLLLSRCDGFALGGLLAALSLSSGVCRIGKRGVRLEWVFLTTLAASGLYLGYGWSRGGVGFLGLPTPSRPGMTIFMVELFYFSVVGLVLVGVGGRWTRLLRARALASLGLISYGVYMYHAPLYWAIDGFGATGETWIYDQPWTTKFLKVSSSILLAAVSWFLIERPILRLKDRFDYDRSPTPRS